MKARLHVSLFDEPVTSKQRTIAFMEIDCELPEGASPALYLEGLTARCVLEHEDGAERADLTEHPPLAPGGAE